MTRRTSGGFALLLILLFLQAASLGWIAQPAQADETPPTPSHFIYLPLMLRNYSAVPTPFPTPTATGLATATPTATAAATSTATPTATESPTPTDSPSATATPTETATATSTLMATATPTTSPTPTRTPTATTAACSTTNVTGTYQAAITNLLPRMTACQPQTAPAPGPIGVIQNGSALTIRLFSIGDATGPINTSTGAFSVSGALPGSGGCPAGATCTTTTTGSFALGQDPMTFTASGRIDITVFGLLICYYTYDVNGTRTSCALPAAQTEKRGLEWLEWLRR